MVVSETYPFPGASTCYVRASRLLRWMGEQGGYVKQIKNRKGQTVRCEVDSEMADLVEALGAGDETTVKGYLLDRRFFSVVHDKVAG